MTKGETEESIYNLRRKIQEIQTDLDHLGSISEMPELITLTNMLRSNEHLSRRDEKKTELLSTYEQYSAALERLFSTVFDIQTDLKEIRQQSSMISQGKKRKTASKK